MPKSVFFELQTSNFGYSHVFILPEIAILKKQRFWNNGTCILPEIGVQNFKLGKIRPRHFNGLKKT